MLHKCVCSAGHVYGSVWAVKGDVHPKMKILYLIVFGALSQMVKVRGACDSSFEYISD